MNINMPGAKISYAELSEAFSLLSRYPNSGLLMIAPLFGEDGIPYGYNVAVGVRPVDITRRDMRRLEELGWTAAADGAEFIERQYTAI